ncbi:MAG: IniB N-terminal domain-containing protein [Actinophytocola sp.]|uniref:IniB N-terminal domain-containing protein n=1 Tax=Actinophytocola sp. TaxID=1872138 RepID=UPI003C73B0C4
MSFSIETLQDFALTLINDEAAKAAYAADPLGVLKEAGLSDLTPADVQEVLPLVADSLPPVGLPADGTAAPMDGLGDLPVLGDLPIPAVPGLDGLETPLGDLSTGVDSANGGFSVDLDGDVLHTAASGFAANPDDSDAPTISTFTGTAFGELATGAKLDPEEFGGSIAGSSEVADAGLGLVGHSTGDVSAWGGLDTVAGDLGAGLLAGPDGVALAAESPLGNINANTDGDFSIEPADVSDLLDVDHLGSTGDAVAGTVAHYTSTGAATVTDGIESGSDTLEGFLTGPAAPVAGVIDTTTDTVTEGIGVGSDTLSEHLTNLPTVHDLPLPQLPELPQLPDVPAVDSGNLPVVGGVTDTVTDTVSGVTSHLPVDTSSLPVDTSAVTGLVSNNPVTDAVHDSPVGGLVSGVTDHLPQDTPLLGDLDLGL